MTPKNKYSGVQRIVKEGLAIILVEADYILEEQELTELSQVRLNEIKKQTERIAKSITGIVQDSNQIKAFLSAIRTENEDIGKELAGMIRKVGRIRTAQVGIELLIVGFERKIK